VNDRIRVLIAGIGGASLGTELLKCLSLTGDYSVFGCDISPLAYGHYQDGFEQTFVVSEVHYIDSILELCQRLRVDFIVPGGERPLVLLARALDRVRKAGIGLATNTYDVLAAFTDKQTTFEILEQHGFRVPRTIALTKTDDLDQLPFPCILKPSTGSGGSSGVSIARSPDEVRAYLSPITQSGRTAVAQEYIAEDEGEFTVGVLSLPGGTVVGSIALRRLFHCKLSLAQRSEVGLISSGYSQGLIDDFPEVRRLAESIARAIGSEGPINVQGRVQNGLLVPFEINPRFSASSYLRALAGFNEIDLYLKSIRSGVIHRPNPLQRGYYLRSLCETYVPLEEVWS
jgi:carbamoyl-phosphate synthase large subunit